VRAEDGYAFRADIYAPEAGSSLRTGVLFVPALGRDRKYHAPLPSLLASRGYVVVAIDNQGQSRNVHSTDGGPPMVTQTHLALLDQLLPDLRAGAELLRRQERVDPTRVAIVGVGIGANVGLLHASRTPEVDAIVFFLPGYGCDQYDAKGLIASLGRRPALLVTTARPTPSDFTRAFQEHLTPQTQPVREWIELSRPRSKEIQEEFSSHPGSDLRLVDWLERHLPPLPSR
jgi:dienelactone hydrolase